MRNSWLPTTLITWAGALGLIVFMAAAAVEKAADAAEARDARIAQSLAVDVL